MFWSRDHARQTQKIIPPSSSPCQSPAQPVIWQDEWSVFGVSSLLPLADLLPQSAFRLLDLSLSPLAEGRRGREEEIISLLITYHKQWNPAGSMPARYISKGNGGGAKCHSRQIFMKDDSLQISQSWTRLLQWHRGVLQNWKSQQPTFISSGPVQSSVIAWQSGDCWHKPASFYWLLSFSLHGSV